MAARKICHRWLDEEVITFLQLYKNMECLWNNRLRDYKNKQKRENAYEIIRIQLGFDDLTVQDIKNKIRGLRTTYSEELNKIVNSMKSAAEEDDIYQPKVFWFSLADTFLRDVTKCGIGTMPKISEETSFATYDTIHYQEIETNELKDNSTTQIEVPYHSGTYSISKEDEYDLFGRSMAMQLRKIPEITALELMQQMQAMIIDARKQLQKSSRATENVPCSTSCKDGSTSPLRSPVMRSYKIEVSDEQLEINSSDVDSLSVHGSGSALKRKSLETSNALREKVLRDD